MAVNSFFHTSNVQAIATEKNLYADLVAEAIQIYGHDVYYLDRTLTSEDTIFGEDNLAKFTTQNKIEMYVENGEGGFAGEREMMTQFGLQNLSEVTFVVSKNRFQDLTKQITIESGTDTLSGSIMLESGTLDSTVVDISGSFEDLIKLSMELSTIEEAKEYVSNNFNTFSVTYSKPKIKEARILDSEFLNDLDKDHTYWAKRGIAEGTMQEFGGGVCNKGKMKNRYVFPIFDSDKRLIGVTGRYVKPLENKNIPKWLHKGRTSEWKYPLQANYEITKEKKEVFLIESIGDMLALWEAGIKNVLIVFGLNLSPPMISLLIKLDPNKIFISFNNDSYNNNAGNKASQKAKFKLIKHFDPDTVEIKLPSKNDFGEMTTSEIKKWEERNFVKK